VQQLDRAAVAVGLAGRPLSIYDQRASLREVPAIESMEEERATAG
jgi:hypothetical protein